MDSKQDKDATDDKIQCKDDETKMWCECCEKEMGNDETNTTNHPDYDGWVCDSCRDELSDDEPAEGWECKEWQH